MSTTDRYDVIIAGAGMAGATLRPGGGAGRAEGRAGRSAAVRRPAGAELRRALHGHRLFVLPHAGRARRRRGPAAARLPDGADPGHRRTAPGRGVAARPRRPFCASMPTRSATAPDGEPLGYMVENRRIRAALAEAVTAAGIEVLAPARGRGRRGRRPRRRRCTLADGRALTAAAGGRRRGPQLPGPPGRRDQRGRLGLCPERA